jgi:predicted RNase H-like nuclease
VLGADGCRGGAWVVAQVLADAPGLTWHHTADTRALLARARSLGAVALALDVPIGLPDEGVRPCDVAARARLGRGASSVFAAPHRSVLACGSYPEARLAQPSLSAQAFGLVPRIRDVDVALEPADHAWVVECHPEVVFRALLDGLVARKKTAAGALQRLHALEAALGPLPTDAPAEGALDDALDAAACAWTARRWAAGTAEVLGGERDARGVPMRIVV